MTHIEQTNTEKNNEHRSQLLAEIKSHFNKLAYYYEFIENFENNSIVPDESEVWPPDEL